MIFQKPPLRIDFTLLDPQIEPEGLMKPYLGPQYNSEQIAANQQFEEDTIGSKYLRAFPVLPLLEAEFTVSRDSELSLSLCNLLNQKLPPIEFEEIEVNPLVLRKYHFIHTSVLAPIDEATGQPMAIEIFAYFMDLRAPEGSYEQKLFELLNKGDHFAIFPFKEQAFEEKIIDNVFHMPGYMEHELVAEMTLKITEAVYSNKLLPNITGGFYL